MQTSEPPGWVTFRQFVTEYAAEESFSGLSATRRDPHPTSPGSAARPLIPCSSGRIGQPDGDLGDQLADSRPQSDDLGAVRVIRLYHRRQLQRQQLQFTEQPRTPLPGSPSPFG